MTAPRNPDFPAFPPYISGRYYGIPGGINATTDFPILDDILYAIPIQIYRTHTFDRIACDVRTADAGTANVALGLYRMALDGLPGALILGTAEISLNTTGNKLETISQTLSPDWYYLAMSTQVANAPKVTANALSRHLELFGATTPDGFGAVALESSFAWTGSMPDPFNRIGINFTASVSTGAGGDVPRIMLRAV